MPFNEIFIRIILTLLLFTQTIFECKILQLVKDFKAPYSFKVKMGLNVE